MRKILATAATAAAVGIMAFGLAAAPAQSSTVTPNRDCDVLRILHTDFAALDVAAHGGNRDGLVSMADLRAAGRGKGGASPLLQEIGREMDVRVFNEMETMNQSRADADGLLSRDDIKATYKLWRCR